MNNNILYQNYFISLFYFLSIFYFYLVIIFYWKWSSFYKNKIHFFSFKSWTSNNSSIFLFFSFLKNFFSFFFFLFFKFVRKIYSKNIINLLYIYSFFSSEQFSWKFFQLGKYFKFLQKYPLNFRDIFEEKILHFSEGKRIPHYFHSGK